MDQKPSSITFEVAGRVVSVGRMFGAVGTVLEIEGWEVFFPLCEPYAAMIAERQMLFAPSLRITVTLATISPPTRQVQDGGSEP